MINGEPALAKIELQAPDRRDGFISNPFNDGGVRLAAVSKRKVKLDWGAARFGGVLDHDGYLWLGRGGRRAWSGFRL